MHERHEHEQYFFLPETTAHLASFAAHFERPCCLCAPSVGVVLGQRKVPAAVLEIDERFAATPGFLHWDVYRPRVLAERFGLILCDPPFLKVSLAQLFAAVRVLAGGVASPQQPLLLCYPRERAGNLLGTFAPFGLRPTGYCPRYVSVQAHGDGDTAIELFGNLSDERHAELASGQ
jgi:Probable N6-adenine methyltransferase